jgi:hypothetical protein
MYLKRMLNAPKRLNVGLLQLIRVYKVGDVSAGRSLCIPGRRFAGQQKLPEQNVD